MYNDLFSLIQQYVYGGVELTPEMNLVATLISTCGVLFLTAIPFVIVYKVICFISSLGSSWR